MSHVNKLDSIKNRYSVWLAFLLGMLLPAAFAPLALYPLAVLIPAALFWLWYNAPPWRAFKIGFVFGLGMFGVGVSWVYVAIHVFGQTDAILAVALTGIFVAFLALLPALQGLLLAWCMRYWPITWWQKPLAYVWIMPVIWLLFEWIRGVLFTGFPWLNLGYAMIDSPLRGYAPIGGVYLVATGVAVSAGLLLWFGLSNAWRVAALLLLAALWGSGYWLSGRDWTSPIDEPLHIAIVQGNQDQLTKWDETKILAQMQAYAEMTEPLWDDHDVIIWPENALTILYNDVPQDYKQTLRAKVDAHQTDLIIGLPTGDRITYYSSLLLLGEHDGVYHKRHLVPFGEYVPLQNLLRGLITFFDLPMSGFSHGAAQQAHLVAAGQPLAPSICYEDAFGEELRYFLPQARLLVNGSNNAWYGDSWAPHQHLQIARMRALETGRMLMRATTNGISAVVDHRGVIVSKSPQFAAHVISTEVQPRQGATPYVLIGQWPILTAIALSLLLLLLLPRFTHQEFDLSRQ